MPEEDRVNVDETGPKLNGEAGWTWCFRAELYVLDPIDARRSADGWMEVLGKEYDGVLGGDLFSAYQRSRREGNIVVPFCLAPLIRDVKFLTTLPNAQERA